MGCFSSKRTGASNKATKIVKVDELIVQPFLFRVTNDKKFQEVYQLGSLLGKGSYGEVRKCTHREHRVERAVKIFKKRLPDPAVEKKMLNEIQILRSLNHPNTINTFETFEDELRYFIVMEYCAGGELFNYLLKVRQMSEFQAGQIMKQLLSAVNYLHENGVMHRDLKPENILIEDSLNIKLIDFGSATYFQKDRAVEGTFGTAYYVAPEVLSGSYSQKCDTWSCGVILYILLSGVPPFDGNNDDEILEKVTRGQYSFPENLWTGISNSAKDLIRSLLSPEPLRLSASEALMHEWVSSHGQNADIRSESMGEILNNLRKFHCNNKLKDAVTTYIATQCVSAQDTKELREAFKKIDKNGDGKLSREELITQYSQIMNELQAQEEVDRIMNEVDTDHNGFIDYFEFIKASMDSRKMMSVENLRFAFDLFDKDDSGFISAAELKKVLEGGVESSNKVWRDIISEVDQNGDGEIDLKEFQDIVLRNI